MQSSRNNLSNPQTLSELDEIVASVINDPSTSGWLRNALVDLRKRDPMDALNDSNVLSSIARQRVMLIHEEAIQKTATRT